MNRLDNIIAIGSIILASFWTLWLHGRKRSVALLLLNVLLTGVIFADLVYYRYFQDFLTIPVLLQAGQIGELGESISSLILRSDLWLIADWLIGLAVLSFRIIRHRIGRAGNVSTISNIDASSNAGKVNIDNTSSHDSVSSNHSLSSHDSAASSATYKKRPIRRLLTGLLAFAIGYSMTMGPINHYKNTWARDLFVGNWWTLSLYNITGLLGFHYYDGYRYAKDHFSSKPSLSAKEHEEIQQWFRSAAKARAMGKGDDTFGAYEGSNIVVVQIEALMNFIIGKTVGEEEITPHFNSLMKDSMYFANYYHQTGQGRTSDADFSSNSSLHPLPTGSVFVRYPNHDYDTLPQILGMHGYETSAYHAYEGSFWNRNVMYKAMGYDHFYSKKHYVMDEALGWSLGDKSFFRQSLDFMSKGTEQPFYSFLITLTSHHPYQLPAAERKLNVGDFEGTIFGNYLQSVHYADEALGQLVEGLKQKGLWDHTVLYVYGDHDNSIKDKSAYEKFLGSSLSELDMHQIMNQVPMLIHLPDDRQAGVYKEPAGQLDMAPSLLHLLGIPTESYFMMGNNLFSSSDRFIALRSGAFTDGRVYYIPSADGIFDNGQCYSLDTRRLTSLEPCRRGNEEAKLRLSISDRVIQSNLIQHYR
ncbi:LTA synthase family protein [Paenibacillus lentus]|uniref:LTA synthase family protein n=2 Tax=Paenibacillus lentus TaxID=1338368 RepID=A0A3Q8SF75_9BACL|nr:LTA synthase family protein [Paenibacillus lentus]